MLNNKAPENSIVDIVSDKFIILKYPDKLERIDAQSLEVVSTVQTDLLLAYLYSNTEKALYQSIDEEDRALYVWEFKEQELKKIAEFNSDLVSISVIDDNLYFKGNKKTIGKLDLNSYKFEELFRFTLLGKKFLWGNKLISVGQGVRSILQVHSSVGDLFWEKKIQDYGLSDHNLPYQGRTEIKPCSFVFNNNILLNVFPYRLISINAQNGDLNWVLPDIVDKQWIIGNKGKVYSVFKGNLKVVDAETGELLLDKPIKADWVQAEKDTLNLFQVNVSSTHLWCGFLGHGLCAVNLETAEIDWHEFDGQSLNRKPIIKNNRIYVQLMSGGIGLDNEGTQEYILEGEGGYIEDSDNEFVVF